MTWRAEIGDSDMFCVVSRVTKGKSLRTACHRPSLDVFGYIYMMRFSTCKRSGQWYVPSRNRCIKFCVAYPPAIAELETRRRGRLIDLSTQISCEAAVAVHHCKHMSALCFPLPCSRVSLAAFSAHSLPPLLIQYNWQVTYSVCPTGPPSAWASCRRSECS